MSFTEFVCLLTVTPIPTDTVQILIPSNVKDFITFIIAVIGFLLSLYNFANEKLQNRMKLRVTYKNHAISDHDKQGITIAMSIENLVANPISISRMFLNIKDEKIEFYWNPQFVFNASLKQNGEVFDEINIHTIPLPAKIEGYGVLGGFFYLKCPHAITEDKLFWCNTSVTIYSNKGIKTYPILMNNTKRED